MKPQEKLALGAVGIAAGIGALFLVLRKPSSSSSSTDANGWTPVDASTVPAATLTGLMALVNAGGAAWQPYPEGGPQSPPVASPGAFGPETSTGPCVDPNCPPFSGPFYAMDNSSGQFYLHA